MKGLATPTNPSPRRPVLSDEYYHAMLLVAEKIGRGLRCAIVLAFETGHRIGSIRQLKWSDVDLKRVTVIWRAKNDKMGFEHDTALSAEAVTALRAERDASAAVGSAWVFPSPKDSKCPWSRHLSRDYWERAAKTAKGPSDQTIGVARIATRRRRSCSTLPCLRCGSGLEHAASGCSLASSPSIWAMRRAPTSPSTYKLAMSGAKGAPVEDRGKYIEVWKKQTDGKWKCAVDMVNSDLPLPAPPKRDGRMKFCGQRPRSAASCTAARPPSLNAPLAAARSAPRLDFHLIRVSGGM